MASSAAEMVAYAHELLATGPAATGGGFLGLAARTAQRGGRELGDEAVIEVKRFSLQGREMRGVRQAVNRVERAGYQLRLRRHGDIALGAEADRGEVGQMGANRHPRFHDHVRMFQKQIAVVQRQ